MREPPATDESITGEDWYGEDIGGRAWERTALRDVDLTETTSTGALTFADCVFREVRFNVSVHAGAAFANCYFANCSFFDASFTGCKFLGSTFERCTFDRLTVRGGDWSFVTLAGADLGTATFEDVRMREADLTAARCDGGKLRNVDLSGASLGRASFERCDLRGSDISAIDPLSMPVSGAIITWEQAAVLAATLGLDVRSE
ncbi:MAG TPA: pentapeptide repeat-containing protein [Jatrophihabitantaceae bacterium]